MRLELSDYRTLKSFLDHVGRISLQEYFGLEMDASTDAAISAVRRRRRWAQARLSNPRYETEARLVIKHQRLMERVLAEPVDRRHPHVAKLRDFWSGLTVAGLPTADRLDGLNAEAARIGMDPQQLERMLIVGVLTSSHDCPTEDALPTPAARQAAAPPAPAPQRPVVAAPPPRPVLAPAPPAPPTPALAPLSSPGPSTRAALDLARRLNEILHEGVLPLETLEAVLRSAQEQGLRPVETLAELNASVRTARKHARVTARVEAKRARDKLLAALQEVCESVRPLALQGYLDDRSLKIVSRQARRNGLRRDLVEELLQDARATFQNMESNPQMASAVLRIRVTASREEIDRAWNEARAEFTWGEVLWEEAHRIVPLDMAWAVLRRHVDSEAAQEPTQVTRAPMPRIGMVHMAAFSA